MVEDQAEFGVRISMRRFLPLLLTCGLALGIELALPGPAPAG